MPIEHLNYAVERWTADEKTFEEVLARVADMDVARAAFVASMRKYPGYTIYLCQKARIISKSSRPEGWMA